MRHRTAGIVAVTIGVVLVSTVLSTRLFSASNAFERLSKTVKPVNTAESYAAQKAGIAGLKAVGDEFASKGTTVLAGAFHLPESQIGPVFASQFPATAKAVIALPGIISTLDRTVTTLDAERGRYADADAIPTKGQSTTNVPWFILITGILGILIGVALLAGAPGMALAAALLGAVLIAAPLVTSLPQKSSSADTLNTHLESVYSASNIAALQDGVQTVSAMGTELQTKLVPTLAAALHATPAQVQAFMASNFPVLTAALPNFGPAVSQLTDGIAVLARTAPDFRTSARPTLVPIAWTVVGGGIAIFLFALWALAEPEEAAVKEMRMTRRSERSRRRHAA